MTRKRRLDAATSYRKVARVLGEYGGPLTIQELVELTPAGYTEHRVKSALGYGIGIGRIDRYKEGIATTLPYYYHMVEQPGDRTTSRTRVEASQQRSPKVPMAGDVYYPYPGKKLPEVEPERQEPAVEQRAASPSVSKPGILFTEEDVQLGLQLMELCPQEQGGPQRLPRLERALALLRMLTS